MTRAGFVLSVVVVLVTPSLFAGGPSLPSAVDAVTATLKPIDAATSNIRLVAISLSYRDGKIIESRVESIKKRLGRLQRLAPSLKSSPSVAGVALFKDDTEELLRDCEALYQALIIDVKNDRHRDLLNAWEAAVADARLPLISASGDFYEAAYAFFDRVDARLASCR